MAGRLRRFRIVDYNGYAVGEGVEFSNGLCGVLIYQPKGELSVGMDIETLKASLKPRFSIEFID